MSTSDVQPSKDAFLGGRLWLQQPREGYRAGMDPVLLAASVPAKAGQSVLDLGCGVGAALYSLAARVGGLALTGVELHPATAELARANAAANGFDATIVTGDIAAMPPELKARRFDHVLTNPPYYDRRRGSASPDETRETALGETLALAEWIEHGARRLEPRGTFSVIQKIERLGDLVTAMQARLGSLVIQPIQPRVNQPSRLVIVSGIKGGRAPLRMAAPFVLHDDVAHTETAKNFSAEAQAVLSDAAPLISFPQCSEQ